MFALILWMLAVLLFGVTLSVHRNMGRATGRACAIHRDKNRDWRAAGHAPAGTAPGCMAARDGLEYGENAEIPG
jgi:hypothetical protein